MGRLTKERPLLVSNSPHLLHAHAFHSPFALISPRTPKTPRTPRTARRASHTSFFPAPIDEEDRLLLECPSTAELEYIQMVADKEKENASPLLPTVFSAGIRPQARRKPTLRPLRRTGSDPSLSLLVKMGEPSHARQEFSSRNGPRTKDLVSPIPSSMEPYTAIVRSATTKAELRSRMTHSSSSKRRLVGPRSPKSRSSHSSVRRGKSPAVTPIQAGFLRSPRSLSHRSNSSKGSSRSRRPKPLLSVSLAPPSPQEPTVESFPRLPFSPLSSSPVDVVNWDFLAAYICGSIDDEDGDIFPSSQLVPSPTTLWNAKTATTIAPATPAMLRPLPRTPRLSRRLSKNLDALISPQTVSPLSAIIQEGSAHRAMQDLSPLAPSHFHHGKWSSRPSPSKAKAPVEMRGVSVASIEPDKHYPEGNPLLPDGEAPLDFQRRAMKRRGMMF